MAHNAVNLYFLLYCNLLHEQIMHDAVGLSIILLNYLWADDIWILLFCILLNEQIMDDVIELCILVLFCITYSIIWADDSCCSRSRHHIILLFFLWADVCCMSPQSITLLCLILAGRGRKMQYCRPLYSSILVSTVLSEKAMCDAVCLYIILFIFSISRGTCMMQYFSKFNNKNLLWCII
jgi:hypothetical protein